MSDDASPLLDPLDEQVIALYGEAFLRHVLAGPSWADVAEDDVDRLGVVEVLRGVGQQALQFPEAFRRRNWLTSALCQLAGDDLPLVHSLRKMSGGSLPDGRSGDALARGFHRA